MNTHAISRDGLSLIRGFEGFTPTPEPVGESRWLVGYGHLRVGAPGEAVTQAEAEALLALDVAPVEAAVNALVKRKLAQAQFDALVSFAFSIGVEAFAASQVLRRVNAGDAIAAACAMDAWRKAEVAGELEVVDALVRRRAAEKALFLRQRPVKPAPSAKLRPQLDHAFSILGAPSKTQHPARDATRVTPAVRLTEILRSEPATEALLLTRVVIDDEVGEDEIVTAHAKPVARMVITGRPQTPAWLGWLRAKVQGRLKDPLGAFGLAALMAFGVGLFALGAVNLLGGLRDLADFAGAAALAAPGLTAMGAAAYGFWSAPQT